MRFTKEQQTQLNKAFQENGVVAAYLFGSYAQGRPRRQARHKDENSDIDIAVLFDKKVEPQNYFDRRIALSGKIMSIVHINIVDLTALNEVKNIVLKHNVIQSGRLIYVSDHEQKFQFERRLLQEYEDTKHLRRVQYSAMRQHLKTGTFGQPINIII